MLFHKFENYLFDIDSLHLLATYKWFYYLDYLGKNKQIKDNLMLFLEVGLVVKY